MTAPDNRQEDDIQSAHFAAAKSAFYLADKCERDADAYDDAWRSYMLSEAKRHRDRGNWHLRKADEAEWYAQRREVMA